MKVKGNQFLGLIIEYLYPFYRNDDLELLTTLSKGSIARLVTRHVPSDRRRSVGETRSLPDLPTFEPNDMLSIVYIKAINGYFKHKFGDSSVPLNYQEENIDDSHYRDYVDTYDIFVAMTLLLNQGCIDGDLVSQLYEAVLDISLQNNLATRYSLLTDDEGSEPMGEYLEFINDCRINLNTLIDDYDLQEEFNQAMEYYPNTGDFNAYMELLQLEDIFNGESESNVPDVTEVEDTEEQELVTESNSDTDTGTNLDTVEQTDIFEQRDFNEQVQVVTEVLSELSQLGILSDDYQLDIQVNLPITEGIQLTFNRLDKLNQVMQGGIDGVDATIQVRIAYTTPLVSHEDISEYLNTIHNNRVRQAGLMLTDDNDRVIINV